MKKVIVSVKVLLKAMEQTKKAINNKIPLPICENYLMMVKKGTLQVITTDLEISVLNTINKPHFEALEEFNFILPGESVKYLSKLEEQPITIEVVTTPGKVIKEEQQPDKIEIFISADREKTKYVTYNPEEFPLIPEVKVSANIDLSLIGSFIGYCGKDELRPVMSGVNISNGSKGLRLCATNAHVLKVANVAGTGIANESIIIPLKAVKLLEAFKAGTCQYGIDSKGENVSFEVNPNLTVIARIIDGRFPNFDAVIPEQKERTTFLTFDKKAALKVIDKASLFANSTTKCINFNMNGQVIVSAEDKDFEREYSASLQATKEGADLEIGVNYSFLGDLLKDCAGESVTIGMSLPNRAITIVEGEVLRLMMPVMINA